MKKSAALILRNALALLMSVSLSAALFVLPFQTLAAGTCTVADLRNTNALLTFTDLNDKAITTVGPDTSFKAAITLTFKSRTSEDNCNNFSSSVRAGFTFNWSTSEKKMDPIAMGEGTLGNNLAFDASQVTNWNSLTNNSTFVSGTTSLVFLVELFLNGTLVRSDVIPEPRKLFITGTPSSNPGNPAPDPTPTDPQSILVQCTYDDAYYKAHQSDCDKLLNPSSPTGGGTTGGGSSGGPLGGSSGTPIGGSASGPTSALCGGQYFHIEGNLCVPNDTTSTAKQTPIQIIGSIIKILLMAAGIIAVIIVIIGGYQYMTSLGNAEQAAKGRKTIVYALVGLVIIILSFVIVQLVVNLAQKGI